MKTRDRVATTVFLAFAALLFPFAIWPGLRFEISDLTVFSSLSVAFIVAGFYFIATARDRADRFSRLLVDASPQRRMWLPARFYSPTVLLWQFRLSGGIMLATAFMFVFAALLAYRRGW
jgi:hypothetical protein